MSQKPNNNRQRRSRSLLISVTAVLLLSLMLAGGYLFLASERQAEKSTRQLGQALARQTTLLIRPSLLSNDRISLNYLLNELSELDYVAGLQLSNGKGAIIARAGEQTGLELRRTLLQQEESIGTLNLWLNTTPQKKSLQELLIQVMVLALAISSAVLMTISLSGRNRNTEGREDKPERPPEQPDSIDYSKQFEQLLQAETEDKAAPPPILGAAQVLKPSPPTAAPEPPSQPMPASAPKAPVPPAQPLEPLTAREPAPTPEPQPQPTPEPAPKPKAKSAQAPVSQPERREPTLETDTLVDLLRPEESTATPNLHSRQSHTDDPDQAIIAEEIELDEEDTQGNVAILRPHQPPSTPKQADTGAATDTPPESPENPLRRPGREETQLPLYSFEQELELILPSDVAAYLFYIDTTSAHAEYADDEDRAQLLRNYQYLAGQVASIYGGEALLLKDNNIQLSFAKSLAGDEHGINAICAAELFILLYKAFNQSRIRAFQPVMNLHMSLVRGNADKLPLLLEEARFLTRTTQSNELISHTALTEAPELKQAILKDADIRREDEDKVLLLTVTQRYQELLQKQANHLLSRMKLS